MNTTRFTITAATALLVLALPSCKKPNHPPDTPAAPSGPDSAAVGDTLTFTASATDPDGDSVSIRFDWGNGDTSDWSRPVASAETLTAAHAWSTAGTYDIFAQARDAADSLSDVSPGHVLRVEVPNEPPVCPGSPRGQPFGARFKPYEFSVWADDIDDDSIAVRFDWGDGDTSRWSKFYAPQSLLPMTHGFAGVDTYLLRAQVRDEHDALSAWSEPLQFVVDAQDTLVRWRFDTGGNIRSSPAIAADGTVYFGSDDRNLYALNPSGSLKWQYLTGGRVNATPVVCPDGAICVGSDDSYLYLLNIDGTLRWRYKTENSIWTSPALGSDGTIYSGGDDGYVHALNPDGSLRWRYATGRTLRTSPVIVADGSVLVGTTTGRMYAFAPDSTLRWMSSVGRALGTSSAIAADGTIYVGSNDHALYALDPDGSTRWSYATGHRISAAPSIGTDGTVYIGSHDGFLYAINPDGSLKWRVETKDSIKYSTPAVTATGMVLVGSSDDCLYAVESDGTLAWFYNTGTAVRTSPAIGPDGTIFFGSDNNWLYALRGTAPLADSPWPKFRHDNQNTGRVGGR